METKQIPLSRGYVAIVDAADFDWLNQWKWSARVDGKKVYAHRMGPNGMIQMHRLIMDAPKGVLIDHRDGLNNTRDNLRFCTQSQNGQNRDGERNSSSRFKGVTKITKNRCHSYQVMITDPYSHRHTYLGTFRDEEQAARIYDEAAARLYGEFACLNFP